MMDAQTIAQAYKALHFYGCYVQVERPSGTWWCSCPDYRIRRDLTMQTCKHIRMARMGGGSIAALKGALEDKDSARAVRAVDDWIKKWTSNRRVNKRR